MTNSTEQIIRNTKAWKASKNEMVFCPSLIGIFSNAIECFKNGWSYDLWMQNSSAGSLAKRIVKEIYENWD